MADDPWAMLPALRPGRRPQPRGGRWWVNDRATLSGSLYRLRGGIPWRMRPVELGDGSGVT